MESCAIQTELERTFKLTGEKKDRHAPRQDPGSD